MSHFSRNGSQHSHKSFARTAKDSPSPFYQLLPTRFDPESESTQLCTPTMASGSSTSTIELQELEAPLRTLGTPQPTAKIPSNEAGPSRAAQTLGKTPSRRSPGGTSPSAHEDLIGALPQPTTVSEELERWNRPRSNVARVLAAFWSLLVMGMNDAAYGAIIPYMGPYYKLEYTVVSLVFLSPFVGYTLSAILNNTIHHKIGQRGIAIIASTCHLLAYVVISVHPPYPVLIVVFMLAGFGNGIGDAAWNAWIGAMANANEVLGIMHACYGVGGVMAPLIATSMITRLGLEWYTFYYVMVRLLFW